MLLLRRLAQLLIGLFLYGIAIAMMVQAGIGVPTWDVLTQGLVNVTGLPFWALTNIIGVFVLLQWIPIRQKPGLGTVLNVLLIGPSAGVGLSFIPPMTEVVPRIVLFGGGLVVLAIASGLYIGARFGPGPRDGLMTGIHARFGWPIWAVRTGIEVTVLLIGWALGGNAAIGTIAFALLIGPMVNVTIPFFTVKPRESAASPAPVATP